MGIEYLRTKAKELEDLVQKVEQTKLEIEAARDKTIEMLDSRYSEAQNNLQVILQDVDITRIDVETAQKEGLQVSGYSEEQKQFFNDLQIFIENYGKSEEPTSEKIEEAKEEPIKEIKEYKISPKEIVEELEGQLIENGRFSLKSIQRSKYNEKDDRYDSTKEKERIRHHVKNYINNSKDKLVKEGTDYVLADEDKENIKEIIEPVVTDESSLKSRIESSEFLKKSAFLADEIEVELGIYNPEVHSILVNELNFKYTPTGNGGPSVYQPSEKDYQHESQIDEERRNKEIKTKMRDWNGSPTSQQKKLFKNLDIEFTAKDKHGYGCLRKIDNHKIKVHVSGSPSSNNTGTKIAKDIINILLA